MPPFEVALVSGDEAQVRRARSFRRRWQAQGDEHLLRLEGRLAGPRDKLLDGQFPLSVRTHDATNGAQDNQRRDSVSGR